MTDEIRNNSNFTYTHLEVSTMLEGISADANKYGLEVVQGVLPGGGVRMGLRTVLAADAKPVVWRKTERMFHEYEGSAKEDNVGYLVTRYSDKPIAGWKPLYAAQPAPAAVPLTDERIVELFRKTFIAHVDPMGKDNMTIAFARAVLAAAWSKP